MCMYIIHIHTYTYTHIPKVKMTSFVFDHTDPFPNGLYQGANKLCIEYSDLTKPQKDNTKPRQTIQSPEILDRTQKY